MIEGYTKPEFRSSTDEDCGICHARDWTKAGLCKECLADEQSRPYYVADVGEVAIEYGGIRLRDVGFDLTVTKEEALAFAEAIQAKVRLL